MGAAGRGVMRVLLEDSPTAAAPTLHIRANGDNDPITVQSGSPVIITLNLAPAAEPDKTRTGG
ncbi:MAG: hypothetical protein GY859_04145 [Desulfobacterales bacterium]|nr:hypothetical protein [Desulfobacterales bacterium]